MRAAVAAVAVAVAVLAACGGGGAGPAGSPAASSLSGTPPASTSRPPKTLAVESSYGDLPLPEDATTLEARLRAMPPTLGTARKKAFEQGYAFYVAGGTEFGIEAADVEDVTRSSGTTADAFERMRAEFGEPPRTCARLPARCLAGRADGQYVVMWGHDEGPIMLVALAPDRARLTALLTAWRATG